MAELSGENGAVFFNAGITDEATTGSLAFSTSLGIIYTCGASAMNFVTEGYVEGMLVTVTGCANSVGSTTSTTGNNRIYTLTAVSSGTLTVSEAITVASTSEAGTVTFAEAEPGVEVLGFYNWSLSYTGDVLETTDFDDSSGGRSYIPGLTSWTVTAEKHFLTTGNEIDDWVGTAVEMRLFIDYASSTSTPSTGSPSQYWKGDTVVTGLDQSTPVDAIVNQSISFQGDRVLTLKTQTAPWSSGIS